MNRTMQVEGTKNSRPLQIGWRDFLRKTALSLACLLLASAGVCWVAANWQDATRLQKLAGTQALLAVSVLLAAWACLRWRNSDDRNFSLAANLAGLAAIATGTLLALVGQIYQTGADAWQLFLLWAVLLLPWLLTMRTVFLALLFAVLLNVALGLYLSQDGGSMLWRWLTGLTDSYSSLVLAALNLALLLGWELAQRQLDDRWRIGPRALAAASIGWWLLATMAVEIDQGSALVVAVPGLALMAGLYAIYTRLRPDLALVSLSLAGAFMLVAISLLFRIKGEGSLFLVILALLAVAITGIHHLAALVRARRQGAETTPASSHEPASDAHDPWFIVMFRMVAGSLIAVLIIVLLAQVLDLSDVPIWQLGLGLSALGMLFYHLRNSVVMREMSVIVTLSGVIMFAGDVCMSELSMRVAVFALLAFGIAVYLAVPNVVLRFFTSFIVLGGLSIVTWPGESWGRLLDTFGAGRDLYLFDAYLRVWLFAVFAVLALVAADGRGHERRWAPLAWALVILAQCAAWLAPAPTLLGGVPLLSSLGLVWLACAVLPVLALAALLWSRPGLPPALRLGAPLALAVASVGWAGAPGISLALLWLLFGHALRRRGLLVFGVLALLAYLGRFYYLLDSALLHKSLLLGLTGGWLLLSWLLLRHRLAPVDAAPVAARAPARLVAPAGLLAGLFIVLIVVNASIYQREGILAHGKRVVLQLAPVDPRSLLQGDYMALDFDVAQTVSRQLSATQARQGGDAQRPRRHGYLRLRARADGVYELAQVLDRWPAQGDPGSELAQNEVLLEYRFTGGRVRIVTNAWFFPEGEGHRYAQARYGEFRVGERGIGLLTGMLDDQLQAL
ncbi:GDYXXLXY domain-containing protein [Allopusillimonas ginsengisoli]|uniref:GDYXXLXY domain-containing protein n=1 Tax=Allopusillimonas ginsengisoli TaxID=453575 RepID=UPI0010209D56|nr:GDYXXLXY domain-containing protein [Allopusillimonas ginsengisoli]TEA77021.1 DUF4401 domain-containing protein [Allopusillimonas ginsengisoli]